MLNMWFYLQVLIKKYFHLYINFIQVYPSVKLRSVRMEENEMFHCFNDHALRHDW